MEPEKFKPQLEQLNQKVDIIFEFIAEQRRKQQMLVDLGNDLYIIVKDIFQNSIS